MEACKEREVTHHIRSAICSGWCRVQSIDDIQEVQPFFGVARCILVCRVDSPKIQEASDECHGSLEQEDSA